MKLFRTKKKKHAVFLSIVAVLVAGIALFIIKEIAKPSVTESPVLAAAGPYGMAQLMLDFGDGTSREFRGEVPPATSALDALSYAAGAGNVAVEYVHADAGIAVQRIDGKRNDMRNKKWRLYINGQHAQGDPTARQVIPMDRIEWKYE